MPDIPKNAKKPSDHVTKDEAKAAKAEALGEPWDITVAGVDISIDRDVADDYEVLELIGEADENPGRMTIAFRRIVGVEQYDRIKEACRNERGVVSSEAMMKAFQDMWEELGNSPASSGS